MTTFELMQNKTENPYKNGKIFYIVAKCAQAKADKAFGRPTRMIGRTTVSMEETFDQLCKNRFTRMLDGFHRTWHNPIKQYGAENCKIKLLEEFPCETDAELESREREWIDANMCYEWLYLRPKWAAALRSRIWHSKNADRKKKYHKERRERLKTVAEGRAELIDEETYECVCGLDVKYSESKTHLGSWSHWQRMEEKRLV
jgi:hypothetical protein